MLALFRPASRGRRKDERDDSWSPFPPSSPETSRPRPMGRDYTAHQSTYQDRYDASDLSPHQRQSAMPSLFFREHRSTAYQRISNDEGREEDGEEEQDEHEHAGPDEDEGEDDGDDDDDEDEGPAGAPLLPIFSAALLDKLPLYHITHAVRQLIVQRCETTLSWDQLRSPQISQFLVKPVQNQIRADHFNRATLCALIANCLQFRKEGQMSPGNVGVLRTRALISELLAMRLLREFTTRELIDALSYDFDPLQGMMQQANEDAHQAEAAPAIQYTDIQARRTAAKGARVSTIEIAIRAEAKRFLAHPLVVQHLEAIWAGNIVFHSEADSLHRKRRQAWGDYGSRATGYGTISERSRSARPVGSMLAKRAIESDAYGSKLLAPSPSRRTVTLYNPRYASLFKLSRLRVPRYRQVFSTLSFATMLALFLAILVERSIDISPLEILFWLWSAGYMLDEVVGFTEQGFGLYLLSFWNAFDLGILMLFAVYYCLRLYSVMLDGDRRLRFAGIAYDVLASTAVLLFPRLFSILDHYRYFSQLLIAFRLMTQDLIAIFVLILITTSGFFVAFTCGMSKTPTDPRDVAYALFQIVMGFTPAAWDNWEGYNFLGQILLGTFLVICHFLVVTILITVLTNSFMAIVKNAEEEHQFLFAINTISMVKHDALFSYVAPSNIVGWALSPLRYVVPLRKYVKLNRTVIKVTHFPILFVIFSYERLFMAHSAVDPTELIERRPKAQREPIAFSLSKPQDLFHSSVKLRESSVISFNKDQALDEVFRRPFRGDTVRTTAKDMGVERRGSSTAVDKWMQVAENEGGASPPLEQPRSVLERLEHRRPVFRRAMTADRLRMLRKSRDRSVTTRSVASDPDASTSLFSTKKPLRIDEESEHLDVSVETLPQETDADGDDEINDHSDHPTPALGESAISVPKPKRQSRADDSGSDYFETPTGGKSNKSPHTTGSRLRPHHLSSLGIRVSESPTRPTLDHGKARGRIPSSGTILFAPDTQYSKADRTKSDHRLSGPIHADATANEAGKTPPGILMLSGPPTKPKAIQPNRSRPSLPSRQKTAPGVGAGAVGLAFANQPYRSLSRTAHGLDLASEIGDNRWGPSGLTDGGGVSSMPGSFSEQLMRERERQRRAEDDERRRRSRELNDDDDEDKGMVGRILLSRMATLEESFREVLREVKDLNSSQAATTNPASRRGSDEADFSATGFPVPIARPGGRRSRVDTGASSLSASAHTPKMLVGRIGGVEAKKRKSPKKALERRESKKKDKETDLGDLHEAGAPEEGQHTAIATSLPEGMRLSPDAGQQMSDPTEDGVDRGQPGPGSDVATEDLINFHVRPER